MSTARGRVIDPGRVARGLHLEVERLPDGRVLVTGDHGGRVVDLSADDPAARCACEDVEYNQVDVCKHQIAAEFLELRPEIVESLRHMVPAVDHRTQIA